MVSRGTTQQSSAPFNRRIVLDVIRRQGEASRKEIIDKVGLSPQTIANITQDLEDLDLIISKRLKGDKTRGQPPMAFTLNPEGGDAIGISLEINHIAAARVNLIGEMRDRREVDVDLRDPTTALVAMIKQVETLRKDARHPERIWGVGVAMPGPFDAPDLAFKGPTVFEKWRGLEIFNALEDAIGLPVFYNVDSVSAAVGESLFGSARDANRFFYLFLGVGLGGALMIDRAAYSGANGNATEIGHMPVERDGRLCSCGNRGCLETYLSLHALSETVAGAGALLSSEEITRRLNENDPAVHDWCRSVAPYLRQAICTVENMLDPEMIVLGGSAPQALWRVLVDYAKPWLHSVRSGGDEREASRVVVSAQAGDSALLGAAVLPIYEKLTPRMDALALGRSEDLETPRQKSSRRFGI
jgi:predicted NBD/HSP70 family sugar kinase